MFFMVWYGLQISEAAHRHEALTPSPMLCANCFSVGPGPVMRQHVITALGVKHESLKAWNICPIDHKILQQQRGFRGLCNAIEIAA